MGNEFPRRHWHQWNLGHGFGRLAPELAQQKTKKAKYHLACQQGPMSILRMHEDEFLIF